MAWLSLAASFLGEDEKFIKKLHGGSREHRAALKRACILGTNLIGGIFCPGPNEKKKG